MKKILTAKILRDLLHYEPETGVFTNKVFRSSLSRKDAVVGSIGGDGYLQTSIFGATHRLHRLAWLYVHGEFPVGQIDHRNGVRSDNRLANLRDVDRLTNVRNQKSAHKRNRLGIRGVHKKYGSFRAVIWSDGKNIQLGKFETAELAGAAYLRAKEKLHNGEGISKGSAGPGGKGA